MPCMESSFLTSLEAALILASGGLFYHTLDMSLADGGQATGAWRLVTHGWIHRCFCGHNVNMANLAQFPVDDNPQLTVRGEI